MEKYMFGLACLLIGLIIFIVGFIIGVRIEQRISEVRGELLESLLNSGADIVKTVYDLYKDEMNCKQNYYTPSYRRYYTNKHDDCSEEES